MADMSRKRQSVISPTQWVTLAIVALFVIVPFYTTALGGFKEIGELRVNPFGLPASWDPVRFVRVAPAHPTDVMVERSGAGRSSVHRCVRDEATNQEAEVADFLLRI